MTKRDFFVIGFFLALPFFLIGLLAVIALIIAIMPREYTRQLRHKLSKVTLWQWSKHGKLSAIVHNWLWQKGNGN